MARRGGLPMSKKRQSVSDKINRGELQAVMDNVNGKGSVDVNCTYSWARSIYMKYLLKDVHRRGHSKVTGIGLRRGERVVKLIVRPGVC